MGCIVLPINSMNASFFNLDFVFLKKKEIVLLRNFYYSREIERDSDPRRAYYKVSWKLSPLKIPNLRLITTRASYKKKRKKEIPPLIEYETVLNRDQLSYLLYISSEISVNNKSSYQFAEKHWIPPDLIERDLGFCAGRFVRERERERERGWPRGLIVPRNIPITGVPSGEQRHLRSNNKDLESKGRR